MGRVSRHKKIKLIDPFSRTGGFVDVDKGKVFNVAPRPRDLEALPKGVARLVALRAMATSKGSGSVRPAPGRAALLNTARDVQLGGSREKTTVPIKHFSHMRAFPGESLASFNKRVNVERRKQRAEAAAMPMGSKLSAKRVRYLEARRLKRSGNPGTNTVEGGSQQRDIMTKRDNSASRSAGPDRDDPRPMDFPSVESVPFGERAMQPPRLLSAPRLSEVSSRPAVALVVRLPCRVSLPARAPPSDSHARVACTPYPLPPVATEAEGSRRCCPAGTEGCPSCTGRGR